MLVQISLYACKGWSWLDSYLYSLCPTFQFTLFISYEFNKNDLYDIDNMNLYEQKEKAEWRKRAFENGLENTYEIES